MRTLAIAASVVLGVLVLGIAALSLFPDPNATDPVVILTIAPAGTPASGADSAPASGQPAEGAAAPQGGAAPPQAGGEVSLPPGFAVEGIQSPPQAPQAGAPDQTLPPGATPQAEPPAAAPDGSGAAEPAAPQAPLAMNAPTTAGAAGDVQTTGVIPVAAIAADPGPGPLPAVPVAELVEESQYGPLPKVSPDGRRPVDVYARPSRYAARATAGEPARIAILVSDLGELDSATAEAIKSLPGPISVAYSAYGRNTQDWVTKARDAGHEVFLQIPLEPVDYPAKDPGPHTLLTSLPPEENMKRLQWVMSRFTGYVGVTNDMGGKFEATQQSFLPVLEEVKSRGLLYLDDGTVQHSTAGQIAGMLGLDYSVANVQIDASPNDMAKALTKLETLAKERGAVIGVASAKPATIKQLAQWATQLEAKGIVLVPVSAAVRSQRQS